MIRSATTRMPRVVGRRDQFGEVLDRAVGGVDRDEIRNVVPIVAKWRRIQRHDPEAVDAKIADVVEFFDHPANVPEAVARTVEERLDRDLVDHGVLEPQLVAVQHATLHPLRSPHAGTTGRDHLRPNGYA